MSVHKFETLFCLDKRNKMKQWDICVETNENFSEIIVVYGCVDDRKIETRTKIIIKVKILVKLMKQVIFNKL